MKQIGRWLRYHLHTFLKPPSNLARVALDFANQELPQKLFVLDIGCGSGRDVVFFSDFAERVQGIDSNTIAFYLARLRTFGRENVAIKKADFSNISFDKASLIHANMSLFFLPEKVFLRTWEKIILSVENGAIFSGHFLGERNEWRVCRQDMTFLSIDRLKEMLGNLQIYHFHEIYRFDKRKHRFWHIYEVVLARKQRPSIA